MLVLTALAVGAVLTARPALAGPPLVCFPLDLEIGQARSLPMGHGSWKTIDPKYDVSGLVDDTEGNSATKTESREHLRRATASAGQNPALAMNLSKHFQAGIQ